MESDHDDGINDCLPEALGALQSYRNASSSSNEENNCASSSFSDNPSKNEDGKKKIERCSCRNNLQWVWENNKENKFVHLMNDDMDVKFDSYESLSRYESLGTGLVRCTEPMKDNQYYWEIKMTYPVYGKDIMVGIGTSEFEVKDIYGKQISALGMDHKSWGLSYSGLFHHSGDAHPYSSGFTQGSIIGIHLDLWKGALSFYKDGKHLGVADTTGLKGKTLYAMASSTEPKSGMRIIRSCSFPSSLLFFCCEKLREVIPKDKNVLDVIAIPPGLKQYLQKNLNWLLNAKGFKYDSHICSYKELVSDDDDEVSNVRHPLIGQYILMGSSLLIPFNRFQSSLRRSSQEGTESPPANTAKRQRFSHLFNSDSDSE